MTARIAAARGSRGITIVELVVVLLVVGILATGATPAYLRYVIEARTVEAKAVAGALWTAMTSHALSACGTRTAVAAGFPRVGLDASGATTPQRWQVVGAGNTLIVDCATGAYAVSGEVFTVAGTASDVSAIRVKLTYAASASPPSRLTCSTNSGDVWVDC